MNRPLYYTKNTLIPICTIVAVFVLFSNAAAGAPVDYFAWDDWGGTYSDAEKSLPNTEDDLMCWAASASNALEWTGWGKTDGMENTDQIFNYFQGHWTDKGGYMENGWKWWFDGVDTEIYQGSQVDVSGGGFYPEYNFYDYFYNNYTRADMLSSTDEYLHAGHGTTLVIRSDDGSAAHAITTWGFRYDTDNPDLYTGIYVTDSDDAKYTDSPLDELQYHSLNFTNGLWYLEGYGLYIDQVSALDRMPYIDINIIPAPNAIMLTALGMGLVRGVRKQKVL